MLVSRLGLELQKETNMVAKLLKSNVFWMFCLALGLGACSGDNKGSGKGPLPPAALGDWSVRATLGDTNCKIPDDSGNDVLADASAQEPFDFNFTITEAADGSCEVHPFTYLMEEAPAAQGSPTPNAAANPAARAVYKQDGYAVQPYSSGAAPIVGAAVNAIAGGGGRDEMTCKVFGKHIIVTIENEFEDSGCTESVKHELVVEIAEDGQRLTGSFKSNGSHKGTCPDLSVTQLSCGGTGSLKGDRIETTPVDGNGTPPMQPDCAVGQHPEADVCVDDVVAVTCGVGEIHAIPDDETSPCECDTGSRYYSVLGQCTHIDDNKCLTDEQCDEGKVCDNLARARAAAVRQASPSVAKISSAQYSAGGMAMAGGSGGAPTLYDCKAPGAIDHDAPEIKACSVMHNDKRILVLTFSERVQPSKDGLVFTVIDKKRASVPGTSAVKDNKIGFTARTPFESGTTYTANIMGVEDDHGNPLGAYRILFDATGCDKPIKLKAKL